MIDVKKGLGIQNISDLKKTFKAFMRLKILQKKQKRKYIRTEQEISKKPTDEILKLSMFVVILRKK